MPKVDLNQIEVINQTSYPAPYAEAVAGRHHRRLAPATGLTDFGASHVVLRPGAWSSQRHWHEDEDELLVMIAGTAVLRDDSGSTPLIPGDIAIFPKGDGNGHHIVNESNADAVFVVVGRPAIGTCHYPDIDMHLPAGGTFCRKDGTAF